MAFNREVWTAPPPPAYERPFAAAAKLRVLPTLGETTEKSRQRFSVVTGPGYHAHGHADLICRIRQASPARVTACARERP